MPDLVSVLLSFLLAPLCGKESKFKVRGVQRRENGSLINLEICKADVLMLRSLVQFCNPKQFSLKHDSAENFKKGGTEEYLCGKHPVSRAKICPRRWSF